MRVDAAFERAQNRRLPVIAAADDDGDPARDAHAGDGAAAGEFDRVLEFGRGGEDNRIGGLHRQVRIPGFSRENRSISDEPDESCFAEVAAQFQLIPVQLDVVGEPLGRWGMSVPSSACWGA